MRKLVMSMTAATILLAGTLVSTTASAGCIRLGETGYHWYRFCVGPSFLYPHQRVCRHGHCWYR
jgi:hypothetical protein